MKENSSTSSIRFILSCTKDEILQDIIVSILKIEGFNLIKASDQQMLFILIEKYSPPVVIMDSGISEIMGYRPWEIIKKINRFMDIKVILISSVPLQDIEGAHDYIDEVIEKDVVKDHLLPKVSKFICPGTDVNMHEDARRLARTIVSDIVYYNSDTALRGVEDGTFYDELQKEIEEGRVLYQQRVPADIFSVTDYYDDAIRDFILKIQQSNLVLPSKFIS
ncbi:MAG: hypothetical protein AABY41_06765 [Nitrospirota bacterium]